MTKYIIESITKKCMKCSHVPLRLRMKTSKPGDLVKLAEGSKRDYGMIEQKW